MKWYHAICFVLLLACQGQHQQSRYSRFIKDALGRTVALPDSVERVICIRSSAIRMVTYAGGASRICGVEEQEVRKDHTFTHTFAHPEFMRKPVIGPRMGGDPELMMLVKPDLIFATSTTIGEADQLQQRTGIPVFAIEYGDLGRRRTLFYQSLRKIGEVLRTEEQTERLIRYIKRQLADLRRRTEGETDPPDVYVGGISYKGQKGLISTDPYYAALEFLGVKNVSSAIDSAYVFPITGTFIDWEQLMDWNPEVIFVDMGGWSLVKQDYQLRQSMFHILQAYRTKRIYALWPYNNYHSNLEVMLTNAWYIGKVIFPDRFADVSIREKTDEIMIHFVGDTIADDLEKCWGDYRNLYDLLSE